MRGEVRDYYYLGCVALTIHILVKVLQCGLELCRGKATHGSYGRQIERVSQEIGI